MGHNGRQIALKTRLLSELVGEHRRAEKKCSMNTSREWRKPSRNAGPPRRPCVERRTLSPAPGDHQRGRVLVPETNSRRVLYANPAIRRPLGYDESELLNLWP
jgi:hypothetical protein